MNMSHLRIGTTFISAAILIACGGPGGSKEDTAVTQALPSPPAAAPANQAPAGPGPSPARILNPWPNPGIELLKKYSATGRKHVLRVDMDIPLLSISQDLHDAVRASDGAEVLRLIRSQTPGGNEAGWGTLKAALKCNELDTTQTCTQPTDQIRPTGFWPNPDIILMTDYEATVSTPTYLLKVHMNVQLNGIGDPRFDRIAAALRTSNNANRKTVLRELRDDGAIVENDPNQRLGWRTLKSALGCADRDLTITNC